MVKEKVKCIWTYDKETNLILCDRWLFDETGVLLHCSAQSCQSQVIWSFSEGKLAGKTFLLNPMITHNIWGFFWREAAQKNYKLVDYTKIKTKQVILIVIFTYFIYF